jgi:S-formylglutathione hydrolase
LSYWSIEEEVCVTSSVHRPPAVRRSIASTAAFLLSATVLGQTAARPATSRSAVPAQGELIETRYSAAALAGNLLGDPVEQPVAIYLPPGYAASGARRYPVVYLLHGYGGKVGDWTTHGYQGLDLRPTLDELIAAGAIPPMIVVVPNGKNAYLGSFFANSTVTGGWDDAISKDLVAFVDGRYRTIGSAAARGVAGHSMGGYGAIMFGMNHPDVFGSVYAMSPCCLAMEADASSENPAWPIVLGMTKREQLPSDPQTVNDFWSDVFVALAAAWSPNPQHPPFSVDFPYADRDGHLVPAEPAYSLWRARMPLYLVESRRTALLSLRGLAIDVGDHDDFSHIRRGCRLFSDALAERDVPHLFEIYADGDHGNRIRERLLRALRFFGRTLQATP